VERMPESPPGEDALLAVVIGNRECGLAVTECGRGDPLSPTEELPPAFVTPSSSSLLGGAGVMRTSGGAQQGVVAAAAAAVVVEEGSEEPAEEEGPRLE